MEDIFVNVEILRALATLLAIALALVIIYVITLWAGAKGAEYWRVIRGYAPAVTELFDEVTDSAPRLIDQALDKMIEAQWDKMVTIFMPELIARIVVIVDEKLSEPPQEINLAPVNTNDSIDAQKYKAGMIDPDPPAFVESRPLSESVR